MGDPETETPPPSPGAVAKKPALRKWILILLKAGFSVGMLVVIFRKILARDGAEALADHVGSLSWGWFVLAVAMQLLAVVMAAARWGMLLRGQGIHAPRSFLLNSFLIARFWGAFTPGGFTGLGGWRIYDVTRHTGKAARATAVVGIEMILGQLAFGTVVMIGSLWGAAFLGTEGVLLVNLAFVGIIAVGLTLLSRPTLFRWLAEKLLPPGYRARVRSLVDAVCAYQGRGTLLSVAWLLGFGVHAFNNLIYVCAARALDLDLGVGEVFFASSLQILATLLPISINGVGLRETAAVALYTSLGIPAAQAVLVPVVGFTAEMLVSAVGGVLFMLRKPDYAPDLQVDHPERERLAAEEVIDAPPEARPEPFRGLVLGAGAGLLAGVLVGAAEGAAVLAGGTGNPLVLVYGAVAYGLSFTVAGAVAGVSLAAIGRWLHLEAGPEAGTFGRLAGVFVAGPAFVLGVFRIRRDVFAEELAWKSLPGLAVLGGTLLAALVLYVAVSGGLAAGLRRRPLARLLPGLRSLGLGAIALGSVAAVGALLAVQGDGTGGVRGRAAAAADRPVPATGPVLFLVVDTLRADHLPAYGYDAGSTPHLDAFARDAVRFDQAFANSSWTRPSFASILTGRYAASHGVMAKPDALPEAIVTLPEAMRDAGYATAGFVTNYNVAPYFAFDQGFDSYRYLEPDFVLGADDTASKLVVSQVLRRIVEKARAMRGVIVPGTAYQDATRVNAAVLRWLDEDAPDDRPWFLFAAYMDPHDPYFAHPYDGTGVGRAATPHPDPASADRLRALYDGEITFWDARFGELLDALRARGVYDDLTIVVTSDHGEEFHEHGGFWHGTTLYDEQVRVPLLLKLPGNRRGGTTIRHWVQSVDLMPSLLGELGLPVPDGVQGGQLFEGTDRVYGEESHEGNVLEAVRERRGTDEWKLITANPGNPRGLDPVELYRVDLDPGETRDLSEDDSQGDAVEATAEALIAAGRRAAEGGVDGAEVVMDEAAQERLRNLGYAVDH